MREASAPTGWTSTAADLARAQRSAREDERRSQYADRAVRAYWDANGGRPETAAERARTNYWERIGAVVSAAYDEYDRAQSARAAEALASAMAKRTRRATRRARPTKTLEAP